MRIYGLGFRVYGLGLGLLLWLGLGFGLGVRGWFRVRG